MIILIDEQPSRSYQSEDTHRQHSNSNNIILSYYPTFMKSDLTINLKHATTNKP